MQLISLEQLEVLMLVAEADEPRTTAVQVRRRWQYILEVARAARSGRLLDTSLPEVVRNCESYVTRAEAIVHVLDEWLATA